MGKAKKVKRNMRRKSKISLLKKTLKTLPVLFGIVVVIYAGLLLRDIELPTVLPVNEIQVNGDLHFLNKEKIKSMVMENISGGYFTVDLSYMREILLQKPWVKDVSLRRKWPASLNVFIEEQVPVAYWNNDAYLSESGYVFKPLVINKELNLPDLNGPEGQHNNVWKFMNVLYKETALLNYEVVRLDLDERRAWRLIIVAQSDTDDNQVDVKLGRFDTAKRMQRFVRILPALTTGYDKTGYGKSKNGVVENRIKVIDMRYPNGFAVQLAAVKITTRKISQVKNYSHNVVRSFYQAAVQMSGA